MDERDLLIEKMCEHVMEWKVQREYVIKCKQESVIDLQCCVRWPHRRDTFVGDYCQNMGLPHFGNEQPGETYYYSPLGVYIFGIVNYADEKMNAYVYHEGEGAKGGNNVCSLVYKNLEEVGIVKEWEESGKKPGKSLTLVFDNCGGQNKNNMMLRLPLWLIDIGLYQEVKVVFLIAGHTKNVCDRLFKDLKKDCHKADIFSLKELVKLMNNNDKVTCMDVTHANFENWSGMFDDAYKKLESNTTNKNHVFSYSKEDLAAIETQRVITSVKHRQFLAKSKKKTPWTVKNHAERICRVCDLEREVIPRVGLKDIKAVELSKKYFPIIPDDKKEEFLKMAPAPCQLVLDKV